MRNASAQRASAPREIPRPKPAPVAPSVDHEFLDAIFGSQRAHEVAASADELAATLLAEIDLGMSKLEPLVPDNKKYVFTWKGTFSAKELRQLSTDKVYLEKLDRLLAGSTALERVAMDALKMDDPSIRAAAESVRQKMAQNKKIANEMLDGMAGAFETDERVSAWESYYSTTFFRDDLQTVTLLQGLLQDVGERIRTRRFGIDQGRDLADKASKDH
jgi:hypothetical protein